jgi:KRAB domain-containing zinc finger protein
MSIGSVTIIPMMSAHLVSTRVHTEERPYEYRQCGKSFKHRKSIILHEKVCGGKSFKYRNSFMVNQRDHTGERLYE